MASSYQKGNIVKLLLAIVVVISVVLIVLIAQNMLFFGAKSGKYSNPTVATSVVEGTIFDRNGKALSLQSPVYDENNQLQGYTRSYPSTFHASQLISEVELVYKSLLCPKPGFDEITTYGDDIYLTIDLDIQYFSDLAVQQLHNSNKASYSIATVVDLSSGEILACSTYPFFDLNEDNSISTNKAYLTEIEYSGLIVKPFFISHINNHSGKEKINGQLIDYQGAGFTADLKSTMTIWEKAISKGTNSIVMAYPEKNPRYLVFLGSYLPKNTKDTVATKKALDVIVQGLKSQGKIQ